MAKETLLQKLSKHFTNRPDHVLRSVNMGRFLYFYFADRFDQQAYDAYDDPITEDPAKLMAAIGELFNKHNEIDDQTTIDFFIDTFMKDPDVFDFDLVADLVESDAYKNYGLSRDAFNKKFYFEKWLYENSMLTKINDKSEVDVFLAQDSINRIVDAISFSNNSTEEEQTKGKEFLDQVKNKVGFLKELYIDNLDDNALEKFKAISENADKDDYLNQLKKVFGVVFAKDEMMANVLVPNLMDSSTKASDTKMVSNIMTAGWGIETNKTLYAINQYKTQNKEWTEDQFESIYVKHPVDKHYEQFMEEAAKRGVSEENTAFVGKNVQNPQVSKTVEEINTNDVSDNASEEMNDDRVFGRFTPVFKTSAPVNDTPVPAKKVRKLSILHPMFDIAKTYCNSLTGAAVITTVSSLPVVGQVVGPVLGVSMVLGGAFNTALKEYRLAKQANHDKKLTLGQVGKIAFDAGIAAATKSAPYVIGAVAGPLWRTVGAGIVGVRTAFNDLERRADLERAKLEQEDANSLVEKPKGLKGLWSRIKRIATDKRLKGSDFVAAATYGALKSAAMYMGAEVGHAVGSNVHLENLTVDKKVVDLDKLKDDWSQTTVGKFAGFFKGLRGHEAVDQVNIQSAAATSKEESWVAPEAANNGNPNDVNNNWGAEDSTESWVPEEAYNHGEMNNLDKPEFGLKTDFEATDSNESWVPEEAYNHGEMNRSTEPIDNMSLSESELTAIDAQPEVDYNQFVGVIGKM